RRPDRAVLAQRVAAYPRLVGVYIELDLHDFDHDALGSPACALHAVADMDASRIAARAVQLFLRGAQFVAQAQHLPLKIVDCGHHTASSGETVPGKSSAGSPPIALSSASRRPPGSAVPSIV